MSALTLDVPEELALRLSSVPPDRVNRFAVAALARLVTNESGATNAVIAPILRLLYASPPRPAEEDFRPDPAAVNNAVRWLLALLEETGEAPQRITPLANVSPDSEIVLEWWRGEHKLTVYISATDAEYVQVWGGGHRNGNVGGIRRQRGSASNAVEVAHCRS